MESFEQLFNASTVAHDRDGLQKGVVVQKRGDGIMVDMGAKAERFIAKGEFSDAEWDGLSIGSELSLVVEGNKASFSKARRLAAFETLRSSFENRLPVEVQIQRVVKGGFLASCQGAEVFIPGSLAGRGNNPQPGDTFTAIVTKYNPEERKAVCSIADYEAVRRESAFTAFLSTYSEGQDVSGTVRRIINNGVFVEILPGVDGFVPYSEMSYRRAVSPSDLFAVGQQVRAKIIRIDAEARKTTLSTKALEEDPWEVFLRRFKEGDRIAGKVRNIIDKGVFVEVVPGVDGFIPASEISWSERVNDPAKYFAIGASADCLIKRIDRDARKISLSFRDLLSNPWQDFVEKHAVGSIVTVTVKQVVHAGVTVGTADGLDGFVPNEYVAWSKPGQEKKKLNAGDSLEVKLMEANLERRRLVFSMRDVTENPWDLAATKIHAGDEIEGTITGASDKMLFVEVLPSVEGVVRKSEFESKPDIDIAPGSKLMLLVKDVDWANRRMTLTYDGLITRRERREIEEYRSTGGTSKTTFGDFFKPRN